MDTVLADSSDHDPILGLGNAITFVGFQAVDRYNYVDHTPCYNFEGYNGPESYDGHDILNNAEYDHTIYW